MLLPVALLLLTNHASGSPTLVELINSGLSIIGAKYVPPPSGESKQGENDGTRQTACRDCSRQACKTESRTPSPQTLLLSGEIILGCLWDNHQCTTTPMLSWNKCLREMRCGKYKTGSRRSGNGCRSLPLDCGSKTQPKRAACLLLWHSRLLQVGDHSSSLHRRLWSDIPRSGRARYHQLQ